MAQLWQPSLSVDSSVSPPGMPLASRCSFRRWTASTSFSSGSVFGGRYSRIGTVRVDDAADLISMITAGHETTTGQLGWALQLLARNTHAQDRLTDEIDTGAGDDYLTATIYETLRVRPVFLFTIPRAVVSTVEICGHVYRPPAHLAACTYLMHRNPTLYREPGRFLPERFLDVQPRPPTWLPWGGGRKHRLGRHFAMLELKVLLREILARNRVLPVARTIEAPRWRSAIVVPRAGCRVRLSPRHEADRA